MRAGFIRCLPAREIKTPRAAIGAVYRIDEHQDCARTLQWHLIQHAVGTKKRERLHDQCTAHIEAADDWQRELLRYLEGLK